MNEFKVGDLVFIKSIEKIGIISSLPDDKRAFVLVEGAIFLRDFLISDLEKYIPVNKEICEWDEISTSHARNCVGISYPKSFEHCPSCGGKVVIAERMCEIAGVEFPMPVKWEDRAVGNVLLNFEEGIFIIRSLSGFEHDNYKWYYDEGLAIKSLDDVLAVKRALAAGLKQAIKEAENV